MLVVRSRKTGKSVMLPLRTKTTRDAGPPAPEGKFETGIRLARHVKGESCIGASDAGRGVAPRLPLVVLRLFRRKHIQRIVPDDFKFYA